MQSDGVAFYVHNLTTGTIGFCWRIWARNTSFYVKPRGGLGAFKISLHGTDALHPDGPVFLLRRDGDLDKHWAAGGRYTALQTTRFAGREIRPQIFHVARFWWSGDDFSERAIGWSAPDPPSPDTIGIHLQAPAEGEALVLDLHLSRSGAPYEGHRVHQIAQLSNKSGEWLTISSHLTPDNPPLGIRQPLSALNGQRITRTISVLYVVNGVVEDTVDAWGSGNFESPGTPWIVEHHHPLADFPATQPTST